MRDALHAQGRRTADPAAVVEGDAARGEDGVRLDARGPDQGAGGVPGAVAEDGGAVLAGLQAGAEAYVDVAPPQLPLGVPAHLLTHLGKNSVRCLDQNPLLLLRADVVVVTARVTSHVLQLRQSLHAGVAAADEDEGQGGRTDRGVAGGRGDVELFEDVVAQADGFLDGFEADTVLRQSGDGERARDGTGSEHQLVVSDPERFATGFLAGHRPHGDGVPFGVHGGDRAGDETAPGEHAAEGDHNVPGRDGAGRGLGEEGLVGHVRLRADHGDPDVAAPQLAPESALEAMCGVQTDVAAAGHHDVRGLLRHPSMRHPWAAVCPQVGRGAAPNGARAGAVPPRGSFSLSVPSTMFVLDTMRRVLSGGVRSTGGNEYADQRVRGRRGHALPGEAEPCRRAGRDKTAGAFAGRCAAQSAARAERGAGRVRRAGVRRADGGGRAPGAGRCGHGLPAFSEQGGAGAAHRRGGDATADGPGAGGAGAGR